MDERREDELFSELCLTLASTEPVPDAVRFTAKNLFTWRSVDRDLAALDDDGSPA